jgi:flavin reductase (DIM6/NTAB) family NADH-FMN oxidoreductase RutF
VRVADIVESQSFTTTTVALVTSELNERVNVMSAEWTLRVSIEDFLIAAFVGYERETYRMIHSSGEFGISYCSDDQGYLAHIAGNYSFRSQDKFKMAEFKTFPSKHIKPPLIEGCISNFECRVIDEFRTGDHAAFIGKVLAGYYDSEKKPLVFHRGKFHHIGERMKYDRPFD